MSLTSNGVMTDQYHRREIATSSVRSAQSNDARALDDMPGNLAGSVLSPVASVPQHAADLEQRLLASPLLAQADRHRVLVEWNDTVATYPQEKCLHHLFEAQVERTPDAVAVIFADQRLTYRDLNGRANQLAHHLRARGVGPEVLVGLCVERSFEMMVGLLGILKAGGAYLPLDPSYPKERLAFMLADSCVSTLLVTQTTLA